MLPIEKNTALRLGQSPADDHNLKQGRLPVSQIAFDVGYDSEAAFTRAFKREMGMPPAAYRKRPNGDAATASSPG